MLRRHILTAVIAALAVGVAGFALTGCKKKTDGKSGAGGMGASMDPAPPSTPVEMAAGNMAADNMAADDMAATPARPAAMDADDMAADDDKPQVGEMTLRMLTVGWKESAIAVELTRSKADARKIIEKALAEAKKAKSEKDFKKLVKKYSDVNKENGGALPPFAPADSKDPAIGKAVSPLKVGQTTGIVETKVGFNIFYRVK